MTALALEDVLLCEPMVAGLVGLSQQRLRLHGLPLFVAVIGAGVR
jgi:hypothetical protein